MQARLAKARMLATLQQTSTGAGGLDDLDMPDYEEEPPKNNLISVEETKDAPTIQ